jgi:hypothetical protein
MNDEYLDKMLEILNMKYGDTYKDTYSWKEEAEYDEVEIEDSFVTPRDPRPSEYNKMLTGVMEYLESVGGVEFAVLKDPDLGAWWAEKVKKRDIVRKKEAALEKLKSTMSKEELKILSINVK